MLFCLLQITLHILITFTACVIKCGGGKKDEQSPAEIRKQIVLARAEELNDQDTLKRTMDNEIIRCKQKLKNRKEKNKNYICDTAGCTPFPTPVTTPLLEEFKAIQKEKTLFKDINEESPQIFRV